jgi:heptosyltransferase II
MPDAEKILVRGVNWLGDAVITTPALQRLREAKPSAHITLLTHEKLADLWRGHPSLNAVLTFATGESVWQISKRLRQEKFTAALVLPNSLRSALEVFLARIPERIGYARNGRGMLLTRPVVPPPGVKRMRKRTVSEIKQRIAANVPRETFPPSAHHIHDYLRLAGALGASETPLPPLLEVAEEECVAFRKRFGLASDAPLFGLNPGAEYGPAKRWPAERFVEAAIQIHSATSCHWVVFGGNADRELTENIAGLLGKAIGAQQVTNVAGKTSLRELCAGLKACALLLTNDTGPMHVAAAVGTPVVVPFGSTSPELTGPLHFGNTPHQLVTGSASCAPCFLRECPVDFRCMNELSSDTLVKAALQAWRNAARS